MVLASIAMCAVDGDLSLVTAAVAMAVTVWCVCVLSGVLDNVPAPRRLRGKVRQLQSVLMSLGNCRFGGWL